jgi:hypothetical protein
MSQKSLYNEHLFRRGAIPLAPSSLAERSGKAGGYGLPEPGKTGQGKPPLHHQNQEP